MEKYNFYYKDLKIGELYIQAGQYLYEPIFEALEKIKEEACLLKVMMEGTKTYTEPIPFFSSRIYNGKRNNLKVINYQTDYFVLETVDLEYSEAIDRIEQYEAYYDLLKEHKEKTDSKIIQALKDYYTSGLWLKDYELDEANLLPKQLKRAVLSQDGLYNLLKEVEACLKY